MARALMVAHEIAARALAIVHVRHVTCAGNSGRGCPVPRVSGLEKGADSPSEGVGVPAAKQKMEVGGGERVKFV